MKQKKKFEEWLEKVREEWKHVPSFKGKKGKLNLAILRILAEKGEMSCLDIAKEYILRTTTKNLTKAEFFHQSRIMNSMVYKRLKELVAKEYVEKTDSTYMLTNKGTWLAIAIEPSVINENLELAEEIAKMVKVFDLFSVLGINKIAEYIKAILPKEIRLEPSKIKEIRESLTPEACEILGYFMRSQLLRWKINIDEIPNEEFTQLILHDAMHSIFIPRNTKKQP